MSMNLNPYQPTPQRNLRVYPAQMGTQSTGQLRVRCTTPNLTPIPNATISVASSEQPDVVLEEMTTNELGLTEAIALPAPPIEYSEEPSTVRPYSIYDIRIRAEGYEDVIVNRAEVLPIVISEQASSLSPLPVDVTEEVIVYDIEPHTLYFEYPPKIPEAEIKPTTETGEIVLPEVVVPEFIVVHNGAPTSNATNHYVRFRDYIKNVASSEIYATWPESSIYANVFAILSFTLNRVYTEWYRSQGFTFQITSDTAFDQKWINGRNIYTNIGLIVDSVFVNYLSRPNVRQPIFTQYCDGNRVQCPNWLSQWGSKQLGDQGYPAIDILRNYYGDSIYINTAREVAGVPSSWPGFNLQRGARNQYVRIIQEQLNRISQDYPAIPRLAVDGAFGPMTEQAVREFQNIFNLPSTGIIDMPTWYKISFIYTAVTRIAQ
ncbi:MAG: hypothetical protein K0S76_801 [Herbinix sp.]|nr:hypothetical protein [Herbinix sp.]